VGHQLWYDIENPDNIIPDIMLHAITLLAKEECLTPRQVARFCLMIFHSPSGWARLDTITKIGQWVCYIRDHPFKQERVYDRQSGKASEDTP
jgi:hypothetical protein